MPLSNVEKQRRWREKQKEKGNHEELKAKDRKRKTDKRKSLSATDLKKLQKAERDYKRKARAGPPAEIGTPEPTGSPQQPFRSVQSLGKAVKRVSSNLPNSPRKRSKVIRTLVKRFHIHVSDKDHEHSAQGGSNKISEETCMLVKTFYCRDDISWQSPNRKDVVKTRDENGNVNHKPKRFLVMTLGECHRLYQDEHPSNVLSLSKFCALRPEHVLLAQDFPHNVCICKHHENVRLLLVAAHHAVPEVPLGFREFISTIVCDQENEDCMFGNCEICMNKYNEKYNFPELDDTHVSWFQWTNDVRTEKVADSGTLKKCLALLQNQLPAFLIHVYIKRKQSQHFEDEKARANGQHVVIQVDFAENYAIIQQDEIQSAHWSHDQVSIFTACAYIGDDQVKSFAIVTDDLVHGKYQVATFLDYLIKNLKDTCPRLESVAFFSDGAASQFKNKYLFENISYYKETYKLVHVGWNFFATSHGKGSVDGIGGLVKRVVFSACKRGAFVNNAQSFAAEAAKHVNKINVVFIPSREIEDGKDVLTTRWENVKTLPNTQSTHIVTVVDKHIVQHATYAQSDDYQEFQLVKANNSAPLRRRIPDPDTVESESLETPSTSESTGTYANINVGQWCVVEYDQEMFAGVVKEIGDHGDYRVSVMHRAGSYWKWPSPSDDMTFYLRDKIIMLLDNPVIANQRGHFKFNTKI